MTNISDLNTALREFKAKIKHISEKVEMCPDFASLYGLEEDFNQIGLTVSITNNDRMILATIGEDNKPKATKILEDYMFIGSNRDSKQEITERLSQCIVKFIEKAASYEAKKVVNNGRTWQHGAAPYGKAIGIAMEDVDLKVQTIAESKIKVDSSKRVLFG